MNGYLSRWPGLARVAQLKRTVKVALKQSEEVVYLITNLSPLQASPGRLLHLIRGHWKIEHGLHYVRDVTFQEDRSHINFALIFDHLERDHDGSISRAHWPSEQRVWESIHPSAIRKGGIHFSPHHQVDPNQSQTGDGRKPKVEAPHRQAPGIAHLSFFKQSHGLSGEGEINQRNLPSRLQHPHDLAQHLLSICAGVHFMDDKVGNHHIERIVIEGQVSSVAILNLHTVGDPFQGCIL
jgi:hypothetical protein